MSDVDSCDDMPLLVGPRVLLTEEMEPPFGAPRVHNHGPGQYCFFCPCIDCCKFYGRGVPNRCVEPMELAPPRYGDTGFVNSMRAAAAKREQDRQDKLRAEREGAATAAEAPKKDKSSKDQAKKKNLRTSLKRRRV